MKDDIDPSCKKIIWILNSETNEVVDWYRCKNNQDSWLNHAIWDLAKQCTRGAVNHTYFLCATGSLCRYIYEPEKASYSVYQKWDTDLQDGSEYWHVPEEIRMVKLLGVYKDDCWIQVVPNR